MRIVIVGRFGPEAFGSHIAETLCSLGHDVRTCDPFLDVPLAWFDVGLLTNLLGKYRTFAAKEMLSRERYATSMVRTLHSKLGGNDCDLILSTHDFLSPASLENLHREFSAKLVLWFPDHAARLERAFMLSGLYDSLFFKDPFLVERFSSELGLSDVHYLPECCRPDLHSLGKLRNIKEVNELGTAGNIHTSRATVLNRLVDEGHRVTVWGPPVARWIKGIAHGIDSREFVSHHNKVLAFRSCKIVLNTTNPCEICGTNVRTFEAAAAGAFQLVNYRSALEELFTLGDELITFENLDDLVEKVRYYLPRDEERRKIADRAQIRALRNHTYEHRLTTILSAIHAQ